MILTNNTMRYGTDTFELSRQALFTSKRGYALTNCTSFTGFNIKGTEPQGTMRRVMLRIDGACFVVKNGALSKVAGAVPTVDEVLASGNTAEELSAVTSVLGLVGKTVYPVIALQADSSATSMPTFGMSFKKASDAKQTEYVEESQEYEVSGATIDSVTYIPSVENNGSVTTKAVVLANGAWSEVELDKLKNISCDSIKFRTTYEAPVVGVSKASVQQLALTLRTSTGRTPLGDVAMISKTQAFDMGMLYARLYVKHAALQDAKISADVMFRATPKRREMYKIAEGTGEAQTVTLADAQVDFSTLALFANNDRIPTFDFNSMENTVTFTAPDLSTVFATYEYEVEPENWQPMQAQSTQGYTNAAGYASTSFSYQVTGTEKGYSAVRVNLEKPEGSVADALLGIGTGRMQTFFLPHYAKVETLRLKNGTEEIAQKNWHYDQESRMLQLIALKGREVTVSYEFTAENPKVYGMVAAWNQ